MKKLMFVGGGFLMSIGCSKEEIQAEEQMEVLEPPEDIEN
jgi:hypothetical protein